MIEKELKYLYLEYNPALKTLYIKGKNPAFVDGKIVIRYQYLYSVFCFIARIFRKKK